MGAARHFSAHEVLYFQDEVNVGLVCLQTGRIKNCLFMVDGTEITLTILEAPSVTGETGVIDGGTAVCSAVAVTPVTAVVIPREKAREILFSTPEFMSLILMVQANKMRSRAIQIEGMAMSIPQRLALMLLTFHKFESFSNHENDTLLTITHDELAHFLGTTRPSISEYLSEFSRIGLIECKRGHIVLQDVEGLKAVHDNGLKEFLKVK